MCFNNISKTITNVDLSFLISEYIREKVLNYTHEEVPHAITCITNSIEKAEFGELIRNILV